MEKDIELSLKAITDLIGALSKEAIHAVYGMSQVGKTTLFMQILFEVSHLTGQDVLFYDTEGGGAKFIESWDAILRKRYPKAKKVDVRMVRNWKDILKDHGKTVMVRTSDTGKMDLKIIEEADPSPMEKLVKEKKYAMVFYDSITMPMKHFGSARENFPARNHAQTLWLESMIDLIDRCNCIVFASHHSSKDPALPYASEQMTGGSAVMYYSKIILYLKRWQARGAETYRTIKLARFFDKKPNEYEALLKLTDNGFIDATLEDMESDKKKAKS